MLYVSAFKLLGGLFRFEDLHDDLMIKLKLDTVGSHGAIDE